MALNTVGSQLQDARKERRLSLADVTKEINIQPWVLEALEANRLHELMSMVYVKGFVTTYAKFLHVEPEPLLAQLSQPTSPPQEPQATTTTTTTHTIPSAIHIPWPLIRRLGAAVAVSAAVAAVVAVNPLRWLPKISLHSTNRPKLASVTRMAEPIKPPPPPAPPAVAPIQPLELSLTAHRTTWVQVKADGKLIVQERLQRGASERWVAKRRFDLILANPSQVDIILNGQSISALAIAHHGRLKITHTGVTPLPTEAAE